MQKMIFRGIVNQLDIHQLQISMPARIVVPAFPGKAFYGKINFIARMSDLSQPSNSPNHGFGTINDQDVFQPYDPFNNGFEVDVGDLALPLSFPKRIGYQGTAVITVESKKNIEAIPLSYIYLDKKPYVYRLINAQPKKTFITLGVIGQYYASVEKGLSVGDVIIKKIVN